MNINHIIDTLERLAYLKYVPQAQASAIRIQLAETLRQGYLDSDWDDSLVSADRRTYPADSEELAEGNVGELLLLLKPVLKAEGVRIGDLEDDYGDEGYRVIIDGTPYRIWDPSDTERGSVWALTTKRCLGLVNELLEAARSTERLWGVYGGNDGRFHLLTAEMRRLLADPALRLNQDWLPYPPTDPRLSG